MSFSGWHARVIPEQRQVPLLSLLNVLVLSIGRPLSLSMIATIPSSFSLVYNNLCGVECVTVQILHQTTRSRRAGGVP
jgi:hypothetical protein